MENYVTILTFTYPHEAFIIKGRLEAEGIPCFLKDELTVQVDNFYSNALGGVKLQVKDTDRNRAIELLKETGYINENDFRPGIFWKQMDSVTSVIPLLNKLPLELRAVLVLTFFVLLIIGVMWMFIS